ncbi:hypothetical protein EBZ80_01280 [bacterium]|nr:hypothetical protein [bacterium]
MLVTAAARKRKGLCRRQIRVFCFFFSFKALVLGGLQRRLRGTALVLAGLRRRLRCELFPERVAERLVEPVDDRLKGLGIDPRFGFLDEPDEVVRKL